MYTKSTRGIYYRTGTRWADYTLVRTICDSGRDVDVDVERNAQERWSA